MGWDRDAIYQWDMDRDGMGWRWGWCHHPNLERRLQKRRDGRGVLIARDDVAPFQIRSGGGWAEGGGQSAIKSGPHGQRLLGSERCMRSGQALVRQIPASVPNPPQVTHRTASRHRQPPSSSRKLHPVRSPPNPARPHQPCTALDKATRYHEIASERTGSHEISWDRTGSDGIARDRTGSHRTTQNHTEPHLPWCSQSNEQSSLSTSCSPTRGSAPDLV